LETTGDIDTIDVYVNDRPVSGSVQMDQATKTIKIPLPLNDDIVRIDGWSGEEIFARSKFSAPF